MEFHTLKLQLRLTVKHITNMWEIVDSNKSKFEKLFLNLTDNDYPRFIPDNAANRYVALGEDCNSEE